MNVFIALKGTHFLFLFAFTAADVVQSGGRQTSPRTSTITEKLQHKYYGCWHYCLVQACTTFENKQLKSTIPRFQIWKKYSTIILLPTFLCYFGKKPQSISFLTVTDTQPVYLRSNRVTCAEYTFTMYEWNSNNILWSTVHCHTN